MKYIEYRDRDSGEAIRFQLEDETMLSDFMRRWFGRRLPIGLMRRAIGPQVEVRRWNA